MGVLQFNSIQHYLPRDSIRFYRLRSQCSKTVSPTHFYFQMPVTSSGLTGASDQLATDWSFPWLPPCLHAKSLQPCPTLCKPMDWSPPGSSVHGIFQARILEWVAMPSSRESSQSRDQTVISWGSCIAGRFFTTEPLGKTDFLLMFDQFAREAHRIHSNI